MTVKAGQAYPQDSINELIIWKTNPFNSGSCILYFLYFILYSCILYFLEDIYIKFRETELAEIS